MSAQTADKPLKTLERSCPCCGASALRARRLGVGPEEWPLVACEACGFVYLARTPVYEALADDLAWEKTYAQEKLRKAREEPILTALSRATKMRDRLKKRAKDVLAAYAAQGPVIEIGCGDGRQMLPPPPGLIPYGIDVSAALAAAANAAFEAHGGACRMAPATEGLASFPDAFFTAALLHSYLEHEIEPVAVLAALRAKLKPGAPAIVKVPNYACLNRKALGAKWRGYRFPDHVNYFTPASLRQVAEAAGYDLTTRFSWTLPTSDNMWAMLRAKA